jgi:ATP-dependent RNA helicase DeaD
LSCDFWLETNSLRRIQFRSNKVNYKKDVLSCAHFTLNYSFINPFKSLGLDNNLVDAVAKMGFETPTEIQQKVIPLILDSSSDIIALAQTGTGKTAAFGLPLIQKIDVDDPSTQAIILCPTRELCVQIEKDLRLFKVNNRKVKSLAVYGGASIGPQKKALRDNVQIVVGTPGRTLDFIQNKALKLGAIKYLVLDEADEMLNMGFKEDLDKILSSTPDEKQVLLFSATMPSEIRRISKEYMHDPTEIVAGGRKNVGAENISHFYSVSSYKLKFEVLQRILSTEDEMYGIIFCRTRKDTSDLSMKLSKAGFSCQFIHGDLNQSQREQVLRSFKNKKSDLLVATDVAARGLDVSMLSHVINYNLPDDLEVYIHRSGRTGRAGNTGKCISILNTREKSRIPRLEKILGKKLIPLELPSSDELAKQKLLSHLGKILERGSDNHYLKKLLPELEPLFDGMSKHDLINLIINDAFRFLNLKNSFDLDSQLRPGKTEKVRSFDDIKFRGLLLGIGKKKGISPSDILMVVNENAGKGKAAVGRIEIQKNYTLFEVEDHYVDHIIKHFNKKKKDGSNVFLKEIDLSEFSVPVAKKSRRKENRGKDFRKEGRRKGKNFRR